jgi:CDP-diacylglycerol--glycerol-3-phosphate 3-phosphatidyltransferase
MDRDAKRKLRQDTRQKKRDEKDRRKHEKLRKREEKKRNRRPSVLLQEFWNLPNMLTLGRIVVIPLFVWFTYDADPLYSVLAASLFTVAAITDVVDGFLARRWNMITVTGKLLDPLADKLIVMAALVMMVRLGRIPAWLIIVLLSREFIVNGLRQIAASEGMIIAAGQEGKWKTALQLVGIVALCIHYTHPVSFLFATYDVNFNTVGRILVSFSTAFSVWSAATYFQAFLQMLSKRGAGTQKPA